MNNYKVGIIGFFATGLSKAGGQEAKTCSLDKALKLKYGENEIFDVDTINWKKKPFLLFYRILKSIILCENVIILPAQKGIKVFLPMIGLLNVFFRKKIFYSVVGGWLPTYLKKHKYLILWIKTFNCIFVETETMKRDLENIGVVNVEKVPNFKFLTPMVAQSNYQVAKKPYKLCTFSRVMQEKGIEDIIEVVKKINNETKEMCYQLDIYGKIDMNYSERFKRIISEFPKYIRYIGMVEPNNSVEVISKYDILVFPTRYYTEGIPGTIIDAYMSGVPVISSLWKNSKDVFFDGITGWGYEFENIDELYNVMTKILKHPEQLIKFKNNCLNEAKKYIPENAMRIVYRYIDK